MFKTITNAEIDNTLDRIHKAWQEVPELRFGQLLSNMCEHVIKPTYANNPSEFYSGQEDFVHYASNSNLLKYFETYITDNKFSKPASTPTYQNLSNAVIKQLAIAWKALPTLRLGELITNIFAFDRWEKDVIVSASDNYISADAFYRSDISFLHAIRAYADYKIRCSKPTIEPEDINTEQAESYEVDAEVLQQYSESVISLMNEIDANNQVSIENFPASDLLVILDSLFTTYQNSTDETQKADIRKVFATLIKTIV